MPVAKPSSVPRWADVSPANIVEPPEHSSSIPAWAAGTYAVGNPVVRFGNEYIVTAILGTGTSVTGPTGTGNTTDNAGANQVVWAYVTSTPVTKDSGWLPNTQPPAQWFNWLFNLIYLWILWLQDIANQNFTSSGVGPWTAPHDFTQSITVESGSSGEPAIQATAHTGSGFAGGVGYGDGAGAGWVGYAGATGNGLYGLGPSGASPNVLYAAVFGNAFSDGCPGVFGWGYLSSPGVWGRGHITGPGVYGEGGSTSGAGVKGVTSTASPAVEGDSTGAGPGMSASCSSTGYALTCTQTGTAPACYVTAAANVAIVASNSGSLPTALLTNGGTGDCVNATGGGTSGAAVVAQVSSGASILKAAIKIVKGLLGFTGTQPAATDIIPQNHVSAPQALKAWVNFAWTGSGSVLTIEDGINIDPVNLVTADTSNNTFTVNWNGTVGANAPVITFMVYNNYQVPHPVALITFFNYDTVTFKLVNNAGTTQSLASNNYQIGVNITNR